MAAGRPQTRLTPFGEALANGAAVGNRCEWHCDSPTWSQSPASATHPELTASPTSPTRRLRAVVLPLSGKQRWQGVKVLTEDELRSPQQASLSWKRSPNGVEKMLPAAARKGPSVCMPVVALDERFGRTVDSTACSCFEQHRPTATPITKMARMTTITENLKTVPGSK